MDRHNHDNTHMGSYKDYSQASWGINPDYQNPSNCKEFNGSPSVRPEPVEVTSNATSPPRLFSVSRTYHLIYRY